MKNPRSAVTVAGVVLTIGLLIQPGTVFADTFVSFNGRFHFTYPDTWMQVDYMTAEYYLTRGKPDQQIDFEAVFSIKETLLLFQGQYLILTVDTIGALTPVQIDSVVNAASEEFKRPVKEVTADAFLITSCSDSLLFDRTNGLLAVETEVPGDKASTRTNLLAMKFYEQGIANFYFYAPSPEFTLALPDYRQMVMSFSTEKMDEALGRDSVRVDATDKTSVTGKYLVMFAGLFIIALAILIARVRRAGK